jgi:hypothetical protein
MTETDGTTSGPKRVRLSAGYVEALEALTGYGADLLNALNGDNEYCCIHRPAMGRTSRAAIGGTSTVTVRSVTSATRSAM